MYLDAVVLIVCNVADHFSSSPPIVKHITFLPLSDESVIETVALDNKFLVVAINICSFGFFRFV